MLFRHIVLPRHVPLQRRKDLPPSQQLISRRPLEIDQRQIRGTLLVRRRRSSLWRYSKILQFFSQDDDGLSMKERVLHRMNAPGRR